MKKLNFTSEFDKSADLVLYKGSCLDLLAQIPDSFIKLIVTSPPYNLGKEYETRVRLKSYLKTQSGVIDELIRVLSDDGSICWQVGNYIEKGEVFPLDMYYYDIFKDRGLKLRNRIVWHFGHGLHAKKRFSGRYETILWFTKEDEYCFNLDAVRVPSKYPGKRAYKGPRRGKPSGNPKGKNPSDVWMKIVEEWEDAFWEIPNVKSNHSEKTIHPCQFPVELVERCVLALTNEDDWVLDPYAGVGSTLIAANKRGRRAIGAEKEKAYVQITHNRIEQLSEGTLRLRPLGKAIHKPGKNERVVQAPDEWKEQNTKDN